MRRSCALLALVVLCLLPIRQAPGRTWTDKKGKEIEAELVEVKSGMAILKLDNGKTVKKAIAALSQEDQDFIKEVAGSDEPAPMPKKPAPKKPPVKKPALPEPDTKTPTEPAKAAKTTTTSGGVTIEVVGLSIGKTLPRDPAAEQSAFMPMIGSGQPGTRFHLSVVDPERQIVSLDHEKSKITACTDDAGGNPIKEALGRPTGFSPFPLQVRPDRHFGLLEVSQPLTPTAGATRIHLQGAIVVECGSGEKTVDQADVPLKSAGQITAGPVPFKIGPADKQAGFEFALPFKIEGGSPQEAAEPKTIVKLTTNKPVDVIKKILFLNAAGKEIAQSDMGSGTSMLPGNGGMTYERTIGLAEDLEKATVRVVAYEKLDSVSVPIDFEIGVGF